jgi:hypothetical protein
MPDCASSGQRKIIMNDYLFHIEEADGLNLYFYVAAESREEAVAIANEEVAEERESSHLYFSLRIPDAYLTIDPAFRVNEGMIIEEAPAAREVLFRAHKFLAEQGYSYGGDVQELWHDREPTFTKAIYTEDGEGVYGLLQVRSHLESVINEYSFRVEAVLYPIGGERIVEGEGKLRYTVVFRDRQLYTTLDELPVILAFYESKFMSLILALRAADPVDGLPLDEEGGAG